MDHHILRNNKLSNKIIYFCKQNHHKSCIGPFKEQEAQRVKYRAPEYNVPPFWTLRSFFLSSFIELRLAVSEEKSKMSQPIRGQGGHLVFRSAPPPPKKKTNWKEKLRSCFLSSFIEFCSAVLEEKSKMPQPIRGQGGHLVFRSAPKNKHKLGRGS